jgi:hypothetical protein
MKDPIVEEVRKARQDHAAKFDFDLNKIYKDLKQREIRSGIKVVSRQPKLHLKKTA